MIYDSFAYRDKNCRKWTLFHLRMFGDYEYVKSAFNGACMYRWSQLQNLSYPYEDEQTCEHVTLHEKFTDYYPTQQFMLMSNKWHIFVGMTLQQVI